MVSWADTGNAQVYWAPGTGTGTGAATGNGQVSQFIDLLPSVQIPLSALSSLLAAENGLQFIKPARWGAKSVPLRKLHNHWTASRRQKT